LSIELWRIAASTPGYRANDLSGTGAAVTGGRWNEPNIAVVYTSTSRALACLETIAHLDAATLPLNRYLVRIVVPFSLWTSREILDLSVLPPDWNARPASIASIALGSDWLRNTRSALLDVPSVIVPEERNVLINPGHPEAGAVSADIIRLWDYDRR